MLHYLAYDAHLDIGRMATTCPAAVPIDPVLVPGLRLVHGAGIDFVRGNDDDVLPCGLWRISGACAAALDAHHGVGAGLSYRLMVDVVHPRTGAMVSCVIYGRGGRASRPSSRADVEAMRRGYRVFGIDQSTLDGPVRRDATALRLAA